MPDIGSRQIRVLVVDDEPMVAESLANLLVAHGAAEATVATGGAQALAAVAAQAFDVILCDLHMPSMDGIETMRRLAGEKQEVAIVLMSGADEKLLKTVRDLGLRRGLNIVAAVTKPVTIDVLLAALAGVRTKIADRPSQKQAPASPAALKHAIQAHELCLYYQPQLGLSDGAVRGAEALVRWQHPEEGLILPDRFIPVAEETGLIEPLTDWVVREAIAQCGAWHNSGIPISVSINLSAKTLRRLDLPDRLEQAAAAANIEPRHLTLEMTESGVSDDLETLLDISARLRLKGFPLSIDDFGTGSSSMTQLQRLPFTELKIDRAFVQGACSDRECRALVSYSVELARTLQLKVVAEGIESQAEWDLLAELGVELGQGNHIAEPMPPEDLATWLTTAPHRWPRAPNRLQRA